MFLGLVVMAVILMVIYSLGGIIFKSFIGEKADGFDEKVAAFCFGVVGLLLFSVVVVLSYLIGSLILS
jgi:uncharacterized protein YhhL (DUF1145 family)